MVGGVDTSACDLHQTRTIRESKNYALACDYKNQDYRSETRKSVLFFIAKKQANRPGLIQLE